ncbi:MAG: nitrous oxide reductase accessory protein NosL [Rhodocyclaceae bacterium]|nr:nitrous oxide reductase accessory protein NosL [Rhodocyclaceae bacterium]
MPRRWRWWVAALTVVSLLAMGYALSLDPLRPRTVAKEQRCPVCGMYPALFPKWMAQIVFLDQEMIAFDSPMEMLRYLHDLPRYDKGRTAADIGRIYVSDYMGGGWLRAEQAVFVAGSRALDPMREADYPAFASREAAEAFTRTEGGELRDYAAIAAQPPRPHPVR